MISREVLFRGDGYYSSILTKENDVEMVQSLFESCSDYYELAEGKPTSPTAGEKVFTDLPPDKGYEDKTVLGFFDQKNNLIGLMDIIKNYPTKEVSLIGLLLIDPSHRSKGLGKEILSELSKWEFNKGVKVLRVAVLEENKNAYKFWRAVGFQEEGTRPYVVGDKETKVHVMSKELFF